MQTLLKITLVNTQTINTPMSSKANKRRNLLNNLYVEIKSKSVSQDENMRLLGNLRTQSFHSTTPFFLWLRHSDTQIHTTSPYENTYFWWLNSCVSLLSPKGIFYTPNSDKQGAIPLLVSFQFFQLSLIPIQKWL